MSRHAEEKMICPNCGFPATHNYCAQCGQENHLHKETFIGLVVHFVAHYFHYDSKFWQTLKALVTKPGRLTTAYWEKKRNRYIPPISLYIFVSIVYFTLYFSFSGTNSLSRTFTMADSSRGGVTVHGPAEVDSIRKDAAARYRYTDSIVKAKATETSSLDSTINNAIAEAGADTSDTRGSWRITNEMFVNAMVKTERSIPKLLFFMIPIMAMMLKVLFARRKDAYFVDHSIFSLHVHAFAFTVLILSVVEVPEDATNWFLRAMGFIQGLTFFGIIVYLVIALKNVYKIKWIRASVYGLTIFLGYFAIFYLTAGIYLIYTIYKQQV